MVDAARGEGYARRMQPPKSREHRMRVLQYQAKCAAESVVPPERGGADAQMRMPLIVEVKIGTPAKRRAQRQRGTSSKDQPNLGDL